LAETGSALRQWKAAICWPSDQRLRVPKRLVEFCLRQDWLEQSGGDLVLSQAGRARFRRWQTEGDPFREQHQLGAVTLKEIDGTRWPTLVNEASPLGWPLRNEVIAAKERVMRALDAVSPELSQVLVISVAS
jgi:hypothetical protein